MTKKIVNWTTAYSSTKSRSQACGCTSHDGHVDTHVQ